ncbi:RNA polymerase-associated protein rtf1 [Taxawa tesnikishii (nom. ined.)]|nr:RNA polymerase-associated protein rtf1 [Dothideales sp. JES 119]
MSDNDNDLDQELLALAGGESSDEEETKESPPQHPLHLPNRSVLQLWTNRIPTPPGDIDDDAPLYPIEGKFTSESDRSRIMAMTEIEREEILAERAAEMEKQQQDRQLKRLLQSRKRDEARNADKKKRKAGAADLDDGDRKTSRQRQRELKGAQRAGFEDRRGRDDRDDRSPSREEAFSDRDAEGESEVEWDEAPRVSSVFKDEPPADLKDFQRVCIGRQNFAVVCFYPTFEEAIKGCFVRVNIGPNRETGFQEGKPYHMEGQNRKVITTDQYLLVSQGKAERSWPFVTCSNEKITEDEFDKYKRAMAADNMRVPKRAYLHQKLDDIHKLIDSLKTEEDISTKIRNANAVQARAKAYERERIVKRRDAALTNNDDATVAKCDAELAVFDGKSTARPPPKAANTSAKSARDQQERLAALNKANRKANSEEIRKAQIAEKRAQQKLREEAIARARKAEEEAKAAKEKHLGVDLFGDAGSDISRTATPVNGTPKRGSTPANGVPKKLGTFSRKKLDDDVIGAMDLGIDIDI